MVYRLQAFVKRAYSRSQKVGISPSPNFKAKERRTTSLNRPRPILQLFGVYRDAMLAPPTHPPANCMFEVCDDWRPRPGCRCTMAVSKEVPWELCTFPKRGDSYAPIRRSSLVLCPSSITRQALLAVISTESGVRSRFESVCWSPMTAGGACF